MIFIDFVFFLTKIYNKNIKNLKVFNNILLNFNL